MSKVVVVDAAKRPLMPCTAARARILLTQGKAAVLRRCPFVLILKEPKPDAQMAPLRLQLDPGTKTTGLAVVNDTTGEVVWAAEITHRGNQVRKNLLQRAAVRHGRRCRHTQYRPARFANHRHPPGWLAPSLFSRVQNVLTWVKRLRRWCPIGTISQELVRFDMAMLQNPAIQGQEYQHGTLFEAEIKEYLLLKWQHQCAYCQASATRLEIDHVHPRSRGGSNRISNLVIACRTCNEAKANQPVEMFLADRPDVLARIQAQRKTSLADAAAVNSTCWRLYEELQTFGLPVEVGTGGRTRWNRNRLALPKQHWIDAATVGYSTPEHLQILHVRPWLIEAKGRQVRQMVNVDEQGFPRGQAKGPSSVQGFKTGDLVRAHVTKGKKTGTYVGRVAIKSDGYFKLTGHPFGMVEGIHARYCRPLHRKDGYAYSKGEVALPPRL